MGRTAEADRGVVGDGMNERLDRWQGKEARRPEGIELIGNGRA